MHGFGTLSITVAYLAAGVASMPSMSSMPSFSLFGWPRFCAKPLNGPWHITCDTCNVVTATMSCLGIHVSCLLIPVSELKLTISAPSLHARYADPE